MLSNERVIDPEGERQAMLELTGEIIGSAIEVHRVLGPGLLESIYESALGYEFALRSLAFERQVSIDVNYKGCTIQGQRLDLVVENQVVVEIKSLPAVPNVALAQVLSYLRASGLTNGLILNFGATRLVDGIKRVAL